MLLYVNLFADGGALLEPQPQGDASIPVQLPDGHAETLRALLMSERTSAALARLLPGRGDGGGAGGAEGEAVTQPGGHHLRDAAASSWHGRWPGR
jgi:hypothetical protein